MPKYFYAEGPQSHFHYGASCDWPFKPKCKNVIQGTDSDPADRYFVGGITWLWGWLSINELTYFCPIHSSQVKIKVEFDIKGLKKPELIKDYGEIEIKRSKA